jgi:hypothetical protein
MCKAVQQKQLQPQLSGSKRCQQPPTLQFCTVLTTLLFFSHMANAVMAQRTYTAHYQRAGTSQQ